MKKAPEDRSFIHNAPARTRTLDPLIKSQLLYQLSYGGVGPGLPTVERILPGP